MKKFYYLFIGDVESDIDNKLKRFVVESEERWAPGKSCAGRVVAKNQQAAYCLGNTSNVWRNPYECLDNDLFVSFVPIQPHTIKFRMTEFYPEFKEM